MFSEFWRTGREYERACIRFAACGRLYRPDRFLESRCAESAPAIINRSRSASQSFLAGWTYPSSARRLIGTSIY